MKKLTRVLTEILKSESLGLPLDLTCFRNTSEEELDKIFRFCVPHDVQNIFASGLLKNGLVQKDSDLEKKLKNELLKSLSRYERSSHEFSDICNLFEQNEIPFLPLKGVILRDYYNEPSLRTSSDIDIFINEKDTKKAVSVLCEKCGYTLKEDGVNEISLYSPSGVHLELLYVYEGKSTKENVMLENFTSNFSLKKGKKYQYEMSLEFFYMYALAHMARHFKQKGTGIRSVLDVYVMNNKFSLNNKELEVLLEKYNLIKFEEYTKKLCAVWFGSENLDKTTSLMQDYVLFSGAYGTTKNYVYSYSKDGKKLKYISQRLWLPKKQIEEVFPKAKITKANILFYQMRRWFKWLSPNRLKRSFNEVKQVEKVSNKTIEERELLMQNLGLK